VRAELTAQVEAKHVAKVVREDVVVAQLGELNVLRQVA